MLFKASLVRIYEFMNIYFTIQVLNSIYDFDSETVLCFKFQLSNDYFLSYISYNQNMNQWFIVFCFNEYKDFKILCFTYNKQ